MQFPKIIHFYWGRNRPLSYLRYLSVKSFHILNPDWQIKLWTPSNVNHHVTWNTGENVTIYNGKDYFPLLSDFVQCLDRLGWSEESDNLPEIHKSDLYRWKMLSTYGGIYSDIDILYIKPISDALMVEFNNGACICRYNPVRRRGTRYIATGFMTCGKNGNQFYNDMFHYGLSRIHDADYQAFGPNLLRDYLAITGMSQVHDLDPVLVYPYTILDDWKRYWEPQRTSLPAQSIGCHWYAGHPFSGECEIQINEENLTEMAKRFMICNEASKVLKNQNL